MSLGPHRRLQCGGNLHPEGGSEPNEENQPAGWPLLNRLNRIPKKYREYTLPETNILHLKIDHWKRRFLLETIIFRGYVSFREYNKPTIRILISPIRISWFMVHVYAKVTGFNVLQNLENTCKTQCRRCFGSYWIPKNGFYVQYATWAVKQERSLFGDSGRSLWVGNPPVADRFDLYKWLNIMREVYSFFFTLKWVELFLRLLISLVFWGPFCWTCVVFSWQCFFSPWAFQGVSGMWYGDFR